MYHYDSMAGLQDSAERNGFQWSERWRTKDVICVYIHPYERYDGCTVWVRP